jgi:signal transduction histidine kinase
MVRSDGLDGDRRPQTAVAGRSRTAIATMGVIGALAMAQMVALVVAGQLSSGVAHEAQIAPGLGSLVVSAVNLLAAGLLVGAGVAILARDRQTRRESALFAGAAFLLAGVRLQYLVIPFVATGWITFGSALRLVAYVLLLIVALQRHATLGEEVLDATRTAERQRLARDLHDGLAQDLAVIAFYGQRLQSEFAPDHPLMVASRRALAASRGVLADLSASTAPDTATALEEVARELAARFNLVVDVRVQGDGAPGDELELDPGEREEIVRIAREAVVNAARHGGARRVDICLERRDADLHLTVLDDGCGISTAALHKAHGFGLPTMRARAEILGGRLTAARRARGGTKLAVVVPPAMPGNRRVRR